MVPAGRGCFDRAAALVLTEHVVEVDLGNAGQRFGEQPRLCPRWIFVRNLDTTKNGEHLAQGTHAVHRDAGHQPGLAGVQFRDHDPVEAGTRCGQRHCEGAAHLADPAVETELPDHRGLSEPVAFDHTGGCQQGARDGDVVV